MTQNESTVLAWHQSRKGAERLKELVGAAPMARLSGMEASAEEFERKAIRQKPDILLVELAEGVNGSGELLERLSRLLPRTALVVVAGSSDPDSILAAMRAGAREYLAEPVPRQAFNDAVLRLARQAQAAGSPQGRIIALMGVKGGVGTSSLAASLAWGMSRHTAEPMALVDLDLYSGDLAQLFDLTPQRNLTDVASDFDRLDRLFMESLMSAVTPNLQLLAAPEDPVAAEEISAAHVDRALDHLVDSHSLVFVDLPSRLDEVSLLALDRCSRAFMILEPTVVCLRAAQRLMQLGQRLWSQTDKIRFVVNRDGAQGCLGRGDVEKALGVKPVAYLPNDSMTLMEAANAGRPASSDRPKAKWSKAVDGLAKALDGEEIES